VSDGPDQAAPAEDPRKCLVVGSYPPVPGPGAAATVGAVRRAWDRGKEVVVVSPRPSAANAVMPAVGAAVGRDLSSWRRHDSHGDTREVEYDEVVLCIEPGWPFPRGDRAGHERVARSLARALAGFERAELVVTGDLEVANAVLAMLWPAVQRVTAGSDDVGARLQAAEAPGLVVVEPFAGAWLRATPRSPGKVSPIEPAELLLVVRSRRLIGRVARRVLGSREAAARSKLRRLALLIRGRPALGR
jgi:hypothetical protein